MKTIFSFLICVAYIFTMPKPGRTEEDVDAMIKKAMALYDGGFYLEASTVFRNAQELRPTWRLYFNIGQCEFAMKRYDLALEAFNAYLETGKDSISQERRDYVIDAINGLSTEVARLTFSETENLDIFVDDVKRSSTPLSAPIFVMPGKHHVALKKGDQSILKQTVFVEAKEIVSVEESTHMEILAAPGAANSSVESKPKSITETDQPQMKAGDQPEPAPLTDTTTHPTKEAQITDRSIHRRSPLKPVGIVLISVGSATLVSGIVTGTLYLSKKNTLASNCPEKESCLSTNKSDLSTANVLSTVTNVVLPIGGVIAVTGIIFAIVGHMQTSRYKDLVFSPAIENGAMGMTVGGRF